jgi:Phage tail repeat like
MAITLRLVKGSELTTQELDDNFSELDQRINTKANTSHTHSIANITGLQDALDEKYEIGDVNVANGLLQLDAQGKVPCSLLNDCFDVASKVSSSDLFDGGGLVKGELLPSGSGGGGGNCDCVQIEADILALQNNKANKLRIVRRVTASLESLATDEDIVFINDLIEDFDISKNITEGRVLKVVRVGGVDVNFAASILFLDGSDNHTWAGLDGHKIELVYTENKWYQIG